MASPTNLPAWPPPSGVTTIHVPREHSVLTSQAPAKLVWEILVDTSTWARWCTFIPDVTVSAHRDNATPTTNTTIPPNGQSLSPILRLGTEFTLIPRVRPKGEGVPFLQRISDYATPTTMTSSSSYVPEDVRTTDGSFFPDPSRVWRIAWITRDAPTLAVLQTERFSEIIELGSGGGEEGPAQCEFRTWECVSGSAAPAVKERSGELIAKGLQRFCEDLKEESEKVFAGRE